MGSSGFKIGLYDHLNMSAAVVVGIDAHRGNAESKVHYPNVGKSGPPVVGR